MFSDHTQYEFIQLRMMDLGLSSKCITAGTYTRRELIDLGEGKIESTEFEKEGPHVIKMNKLAGIAEVVFSLDEFDNTNDLSNGSPSNALLTYHVTSYEDSMHFKHHTPQYKKHQKDQLVPLVLRMKHMKNKIVADGPVMTVVLHIR